MGFLKTASQKVFGTPEERKRKQKEKEEVRHVYRKELLRERKKQAKIRARRDAKAGGGGFIDRLGGGLEGFSRGVENLNKIGGGPDFLGFGPSPTTKKKPKKKQTGKPKRKEVYYY